MNGPLIHPGEILNEEFLKPLGLSAIALAKLCNVPRTRFERVVAAKTAITPDTALRLSKALGTTPQFWMTLQTRYDLATTANRLDLDDIKPIKVA